MTTVSAPPAGHTEDDAAPRAVSRVALVGNPNVGKTTLFNRLAGVRHKTANFPGTTQEADLGPIAPGVTGIDLPGVYSLELSTSESEIARAVLSGDLAPVGEHAAVPDAVLIVLDAMNLSRNLRVAGEVIRAGGPVVVALNMIDAARRRGLHLDAARLSDMLGCAVVPVSARTGEGLDELRSELSRARASNRTPPADEAGLERWADEVFAAAASSGETAPDRLTDRLDRAFTHPVMGVLAFAAVMTGLFYVIFRLAAYPMDWIDAIFAWAGGAIGGVIPPGLIHDLLVDGVVAGVGATVIFLPQICLLFFLMSLLEGTGYLARAAFVIDRLLRPFGLSGHAFVPLLSGHACALPGIMAARAIPDRRDRLATILSLPFMSCTARIPVYVLLTGLLFPESPAMQAVAFTGCYVLGVAAGLFSALIARRTILKGKSRPMALELPSYRMPDLRSALLATRDRGWVFLRKAGTVIVVISMVLWWAGEFPRSEPPQQAVELRAQAEGIEPTDAARAAELSDEADAVESRHAAANSFMGRLGTAIQPVFAPTGADRQLTVGILASFAAREVFVTTMAVQVVGVDDTEDEGVLSALANAERDDGTPVFNAATSWAMLVYFVLAMQCLPTLVVTAREAGGWKWAGLQLGWMTAVAYGFAAATYLAVSAMGS